MKKTVILLILISMISACMKENTVKNDTIHSKCGYPSPTDWRDETIYFLLTDRFFNGNTNNDKQTKTGYEFGKTEYQWNGGDFEGIIAKLDYIKDLGFTAIWITPPVLNQIWDASIPYGGYHGYWASSFTNTDPHYGSLAEYKRMVGIAHSKGIRVIQDIVCNHTGNFLKSRKDGKGLELNTGAEPQYPVDPFLSNSIVAYLNGKTMGKPEMNAYHWNPEINNWNDWDQLLNYQASSLDDLNTENPETVRYLKEAYRFWIREADIDGFRIDTAKNIPKDFWNDFCFSTDPNDPGMMEYAKSLGKSNFIMAGEVWTPGASNENALAAGYTHDGKGKAYLQSVLNYPLFSVVRRLLIKGEKTELMKEYEEGIDYYRADIRNRLISFIDNHDNNRFLSISGIRQLKLALMMIYTLPGVPCVYYGTEQKFTVARACMFKDGYKGGMDAIDTFQTNSEMAVFIRNLNRLRLKYDALRYGDQKTVVCEKQGSGTLAFIRKWQDKKALIVFNTSKYYKYVPEIPTGVEGDLTFVNVLNPNNTERVRSDGKGNIGLVLSPMSVYVFIPEQQVKYDF